MRSKHSITLGLRWFKDYINQGSILCNEPLADVFRSARCWGGLAVGLLISALIYYWLVQHLLFDQQGWSLFGRAVFVGSIASVLTLIGTEALVVAISGAAPIPHAGFASTGATTIGTMIGFLTAWPAGSLAIGGLAAGIILLVLIMCAPIAIAGVGLKFAMPTTLMAARSDSNARKLSQSAGVAIFLFCIATGVALGVWLRSMLIRFGATAYYARTGFWLIPRNFMNTLFAQDMFHPAELMPGYFDGDPYTRYTSRGLFRRAMRGSNPFWKIADFIMFFIYFFPAYLYRLSIKSTFWVYVPVAYILHVSDTELKPAHFLERLSRSPFEKIRRLLALSTAIIFAGTTIYYLVSNPSQAPPGKLITPWEYIFVLDIKFWQKPWQFFALLSAIITGYLILAAGNSRIDLNYAKTKRETEVLVHDIGRLKLLVRARSVASAILTLFLVVHSLLMFTPLLSWLPPYIVDKLRWLYGAYMPLPLQ